MILRIAAHRLAQLFGAARHIQNVVLDLEGQPQLFAIQAGFFHFFFSCTGQSAAHLTGRHQQAAGFQMDHLGKLLFLRTPCFKIQIHHLSGPIIPSMPA